jgi:predicted secreted hydrolase
MSVRRWTMWLLMAWLALAGPAHAQGFAGLGTGAEGFALPEQGRTFSFPADHGAHPGYRIEWWYITANLKAADGTDYGVQWTLFRTALAPGTGDEAGWSSPQLWMGHAALTTPKTHYVAERLARGGVGQAGVTASPFAAWIDNWEMTGSAGVGAGAGADAVSSLALKASGEGFSYDLKLTADGPIVLQGDRGYSVKSASGQASHYYSQPFYEVTGRLVVESKTIEVTGKAWLDREWSSQPLASDQTGWDWFSLHFDSGDKLMGFHLRDGGAGFTSATWISIDGKAAPIAPGRLKLTPLGRAEVAGRSLPVRWRVELPERGLNVATEPVNAKAWMATSVPYWEGPVRVTGTHAGRGYLEMTGYE